VEWVRIEERPIALASAVAPTGFDDEISTVAHRLREILTPDGLFVLVQLGDGVQLVARSSVDEVDAGLVARHLGGGGHSRAAAAMIVGGRLPGRGRVRAVLPLAVQPTRARGRTHVPRRADRADYDAGRRRGRRDAAPRPRGLPGRR
jgi:tRNA nucleotidyltransferase (CCA-adding enzyme)